MPLGGQQPNPAYLLWLRLDQLIRACMFAIISKNHVIEVRDIVHCLPIWQHLESRFSTASLASVVDLKRTLSNLHKLESQCMDDYLHQIKSIVDSLVAVKSPVSGLELI